MVGRPDIPARGVGRRARHVAPPRRRPAVSRWVLSYQRWSGPPGGRGRGNGTALDMAAQRAAPLVGSHRAGAAWAGRGRPVGRPLGVRRDDWDPAALGTTAHLRTDPDGGSRGRRRGAGGRFNGVDGEARPGLASFDVDTGQIRALDGRARRVRADRTPGDRWDVPLRRHQHRAVLQDRSPQWGGARVARLRQWCLLGDRAPRRRSNRGGRGPFATGCDQPCRLVATIDAADARRAGVECRARD